VNVKDKYGHTALRRATILGQTDVVIKLLQEYGAKD